MRLRNRVALIAVLLLGGCGLSGCTARRQETSVFVDPQFATLVPPDTTLIVGTRVEHLVKTPLYEKYLGGGRINIIDRVARGTGIDPEKKLWNLLYVSNGSKSFVLGRGKFADELMAPDFSKPGVRRFSYNKTMFFGDEQQALMLVNSSTIAIGETDTLRALVDQRPSITGLPPSLAALTKEIPYQTQFWGAYAGGPVDIPFTGNLQNVNRVLGMIGQGVFYFDLTQGVTGMVRGDARTAQDAREVHDALEGFLGLGRMLGPKSQPALLRVFDGIHVAQDGPRVTVNVQEPADLAGEFLDRWLKQ
ncbi:MAG: hypothetical protein EXQ47_06450 [Bryobacterales bacterium]|nr:hypothetical protein [Bryobacterales bacterium]